MSKKDENAKASTGQNPEGVDVQAKEMLLKNGKEGTVIRYTDRVKIRLIKDTKHQKAGKVYSPHKVKADWLVEQKIAEYVK